MRTDRRTKSPPTWTRISNAPRATGADRPEADERRMAGAAGHHGQGRGRGALPQRARGQDAVRRAAAARPDQRAAAGATGTCASRAGSLRKLAKAVAARSLVLLGVAIVAIAEFPDQVGTTQPPLAQVAAAGLARARSGESRPLARPELVDRGPALVPSCKPGHRDIPGALRLVHRAGTAGHSSVHPARHACRRAYLERFGFIPSPKSVRTDADDACAASAIRTWRRDRAGAGVRRRPAADAGRKFRRPAGRVRAHDRRHESRHRRRPNPTRSG